MVLGSKADTPAVSLQVYFTHSQESKPQSPRTLCRTLVASVRGAVGTPERCLGQVAEAHLSAKAASCRGKGADRKCGLGVLCVGRVYYTSLI